MRPGRSRHIDDLESNQLESRPLPPDGLGHTVGDFSPMLFKLAVKAPWHRPLTVRAPDQDIVFHDPDLPFVKPNVLKKEVDRVRDANPALDMRLHFTNSGNIGKTFR